MKFFLLHLYYVSSYKLITFNKRSKVRANLCQRKSKFYTQILIFLRLVKNVLIKKFYGCKHR